MTIYRIVEVQHGIYNNEQTEQVSYRVERMEGRSWEEWAATHTFGEAEAIVQRMKPQYAIKERKETVVAEYQFK